MLSLIASTLIVAPDYTIQMGRTVPVHALCRTLNLSQKNFTGHNGKITNYTPCTIELDNGAGACVLRKRTARCWLYNKPDKGIPRPRVALGGTRLSLAFIPIGHIPIVQPLIDLFRPKPQVKPKRTWADAKQCMNEAAHRQIQNGEKVDNAANRKACIPPAPRQATGSATR